MPELLITIGSDTDADQHELAELTGWLRSELLELNVESVEPASIGEPPPKAKGVEALAVGALVVEMAHSSGVLRTVLGTVQSWLAGYRGRTVKVEMDGDAIEMTGVTSSDQQRLIDAWMTRHANR